MKIYTGFFMFIMILIISNACSIDDDKDYYSVLGTINKSNDSIIIISDDDERLLVNNYSSISSTVDDNDRVYAYFTLSEEFIPSNVDYVIDIYDIDVLLCKPVIELTTENADSIGNDELKIDGIWIAKNYMNLNFRFYANSKTHLINLVRQQGVIPTDTIDLEIRHNANDDSEVQLYSAFVSFDLSSLRNEVADSVILHVTAREYDNRTYNNHFVYKF